MITGTLSGVEQIGYDGTFYVDGGPRYLTVQNEYITYGPHDDHGLITDRNCDT